LIGLEQAIAESQLQALGLLLVVQDGRFDNNVLPQRIITQLIPAGTLLSQGQVVEVIVSRGREKVKAPPVVGLTVQEAQNRLSSLGLAIERRDAPSTQSPAGVVLSQDPVAETEVEWGGVVRVVVSIGDRVAVPSLVGKTEAEAQRLIEQAGLSTTFPNYQSADDVPTQLRAAFNSIPDGSVVSSDPAAGIFLARGDIVKIAVRNR
jgi:serine/threonine-protein kinase